MTLDIPEHKIVTNPRQGLYNAIKDLIDAMYDAAQDLVDEIAGTVIGQDLWITLPYSKLSFRLIYWSTELQSWVIPDFRLPDKTFTSATFTIPGFSYTFDINFNWNFPWDIILPNLTDIQLSSDPNMYWKTESGYQQGSSIGRYYMLSDGIMDGLIIGTVIALIAILMHMGLGALATKLQSSKFSTASVTTAINNYKLTQTLSTQTTKLNNLQTTTDSISDTTEDTSRDVKSTLSDIQKLTSIANGVTSALSKLDDVKTSLETIGLSLPTIDQINSGVSDLNDLIVSYNLNATQDDLTLIKTKLDALSQQIGLRFLFT